jgi:TusA-related sulfurtransferase
MAQVTLDYRGLNCPLPVLNLNAAVVTKEVESGDLVEVLADCPTFAADVTKWCQTSRKILVSCRADGDHTVAVVQL